MIEVVQAGVVDRCQAKHPDTEHQCDHFADHFGSHQHAVSKAECLRWPSEDDVHEAQVSAELDAMTDEEVEAMLVDEENGVTREVVRDWSKGAGVFAKAMVAAKREAESLRAEIEGMRNHPFSDVIEKETSEAIAAFVADYGTDNPPTTCAEEIRAGRWRTWRDDLAAAEAADKEQP